MRRRIIVAIVLLAALAVPATAWAPPIGIPTPARSPGAGRIVFTRAAAGSEVTQIATAEPDGSDVRILTHLRHGANQPAWSVDGTRIVFLRFTEAPDGFTPDDIWVMDADGSAPVRLTRTPGIEQQPSFAPDGSRIVYELDGQLFVMDVAGGDPVQITDEDEGGLYPAWSPDGASIAYARYEDDRTGWDIVTIRPDGTDLVPLTDLPGRDIDPSWSADGSRLTFQRREDVAVMDADGTGLVRVTTTRRLELSPAWSPDASTIVFASGPREMETNIATIEPDGSGRTTILGRRAVWFDWPAWS